MGGPIGPCHQHVGGSASPVGSINENAKQHSVAEFYEEHDELFYVMARKVLNKAARSGVIGCHEIREEEPRFGPGSRNEAASRMANVGVGSFFLV